MTRQSDLRARFLRELGTVRQHAPDLDVTLKIGKASEFPAKRDYAYCASDGDKAVITVAPKMLRAPAHRQTALLRHELAHAYLMAHDLDHTERECDAVAERLFDAPIYYDADLVQTVRKASAKHRRRPSHLPTGEEDAVPVRRNCGSCGKGGGGGCSGARSCCGGCPSCPLS